MRADDTSVTDDAQREQSPLGLSLHSFEARRPHPKLRLRALEVAGVCGALCVPVGIGLVNGTVGTVMAVAGGLVALVAFLLSSKAKAPPSTKIEIHELGLSCAQGKGSRVLRWNEVLDVSCHKMPSTNGEPSMALVFEVVSGEPLLIIVGGTFSEVSETAQLLDMLAMVWVPIWCRRSRVLVEHALPVEVGGALVQCGCITLRGEEIAWSDIQGAQGDRLKTREGEREVEGDQGISPFPSAAKRLAALALHPPVPPLLPPARAGDAAAPKPGAKIRKTHR
jgi:hypothetical protein